MQVLALTAWRATNLTEVLPNFDTNSLWSSLGERFLDLLISVSVPRSARCTVRAVRVAPRWCDVAHCHFLPRSDDSRGFRRFSTLVIECTQMVPGTTGCAMLRMYDRQWAGNRSFVMQVGFATKRRRNGKPVVSRMMGKPDTKGVSKSGFTHTHTYELTAHSRQESDITIVQIEKSEHFVRIVRILTILTIS